MVGKHDQHLRFQGLKFEPAAMQLTNFGQRRLLVHQNWKPQYGKQIESKLITMKIVRLNLCVFSGSLPSTLMAVMWFGISCLFRPIGPWMRSWRCLGCAREKQLSCARGWWWWWWWRRRRRRRWCLAPPHPPRLCVQPSRNLCVQVSRRPQSFQVRFPSGAATSGQGSEWAFHVGSWAGQLGQLGQLYRSVIFTWKSSLWSQSAAQLVSIWHLRSITDSNSESQCVAKAWSKAQHPRFHSCGSPHC